jgi:hypothetical protein
MALQPRPAICDRARTWVSLRLDGELSELEEVLLASHLRSCASCRDYEESVRGTVLALRGRPLEQLGQEVAVPSRRRFVLGPTALAGAAAIVAAAIGLTTLLGSESVHRLPRPAGPSLEEPGYVDLQQSRLLRVAQLGAKPKLAPIGIHGAAPQSGARL